MPSRGSSGSRAHASATSAAATRRTANETACSKVARGVTDHADDATARRSSHPAAATGDRDAPRSAAPRGAGGDGEQHDEHRPAELVADPIDLGNRARAADEREDRERDARDESPLERQRPEGNAHGGQGYSRPDVAYPERIVPDDTEPGIVALHLKRYVFAEPWCRDKDVLDLACGVGYGSAYLAGVRAPRRRGRHQRGGGRVRAKPLHRSERRVRRRGRHRTPLRGRLLRHRVLVRDDRAPARPRRVPRGAGPRPPTRRHVHRLDAERPAHDRSSGQPVPLRRARPNGLRGAAPPVLRDRRAVRAAPAADAALPPAPAPRRARSPAPRHAPVARVRARRHRGDGPSGARRHRHRARQSRPREGARRRVQLGRANEGRPSPDRRRRRRRPDGRAAARPRRARTRPRRVVRVPLGWRIRRPRACRRVRGRGRAARRRARRAVAPPPAARRP